MANDAESTLRNRFAGTAILLVEDNAINRELALELLHGVGLSVETAIHGVEAVEKACQFKFALILMDMQMPVMDGMAAAQAIRALPNSARVPMVAFTANAFGEDREQCRLAGMDDFISKPVEIQPLEAALRKLQCVDTAYGLRIMRGDAKRYAKLLAKSQLSALRAQRCHALSLASGPSQHDQTSQRSCSHVKGHAEPRPHLRHASVLHEVVVEGIHHAVPAQCDDGEPRAALEARHRREKRIEATMRGTCPTTSRRSPRRRPATNIRQWMKVCRPVVLWASTWARSRCRKAVSKSARFSASSACCTSRSYASSIAVLLACANARLRSLP